MLKKNKSIKEILREVGESSTSHGIPSIIRNENVIIKLLWLICLLGSTGYCAYGLTKSIREFFNYDVVSQLRNERVSSLEFPTITFCNKNPYDLNKNPNSSLNEKIGIKNLNYVIYSSLIFKRKPLDLMRIVDYIISNGFYSYNQGFYGKVEGFETYTFSINDTLLGCRFNDKTCDYTDFEAYYDTKFGACFKFNSGKNFTGHLVDKKISSLPGRRNALKLELFTGYSNSEYDLIRSTGAHLFIHNSSTKPLSDIDGISLSTGYETDIIVKQTFIKKLSKPYSDCIINTTSIDSFDSKLFKQTIELNEIYQQKFCLKLCTQEYIIEKCDCFDLDSIEIKNSKPCTQTNKDCIFIEYQNFLSSQKLKECFDSCPEECDAIHFDLKLSQADFPSPFYSNLLIKHNEIYPNYQRNFTTHEQVKQSVLALNVYFDDISYSLYDETPAKVLEDLVADVGGYMGLFVGVSLLSFVEIIELIFKIMIYFFKSWYLKKKMSKIIQK